MAPSPPEAPTVDTQQVTAEARRLALLRTALAEIEKRHTRPRLPPPPSPPARPAQARSLPGQTRETPDGPLQLVQTKLSAAHRHGTSALDRALSADAANLALVALDPELAGADLGRALYLDTETTGLAGGTGTLPFLIGLAWFEDGALAIEQLLLRAPGEERPLLSHLGDRLAAATALVTFNGKAFDWPLLVARFVLNRVPLPDVPPHLDLLHCARRVFRRRLESVRLGEVESHVLGFERDGDIDGAEIPPLYWAYLRGGDGSLLEPVLRHNTMDLTAMAALVGTLSDRVALRSPNVDARDELCVAEVALRHRDPIQAAAHASRAAAAQTHAEARARALLLLADLKRREREFAEAAQLLHQALERLGSLEMPKLGAQIHLTLAKVYEHGLHDPARAIEHAAQSAEAEGASAMSHRLARLREKMLT